ncbi:MAG: hypothetical protein V8Q79_05920 [Christensenellales bacterium]
MLKDNDAEGVVVTGNPGVDALLAAERRLVERRGSRFSIPRIRWRSCPSRQPTSVPSSATCSTTPSRAFSACQTARAIRPST